MFSLSTLQQSHALILDEDTKAASGGAQTGLGLHVEEGCIAWDPHSAKQCAVGLGCGLKLVDTREMEVTAHHATAHDETIRYKQYFHANALLWVYLLASQNISIHIARAHF